MRHAPSRPHLGDPVTVALHRRCKQLRLRRALPALALDDRRRHGVRESGALENRDARGAARHRKGARDHLGLIRFRG